MKRRTRERVDSMLFPGKIIERKKFGEKEIIFRLPQKSDALLCMRYINALVSERARILATKKVTLKKEKEWLKKLLEEMRKKMTFPIFITDGDRIIGIAVLSRDKPPPLATSHLGVFAIGLLKEYRGLGIASYAAQLLFNFGKKVWKLDGIRSSYAVDNLASARLHRKLGFKTIGKIPKGLKYGKEYVDHILVFKKL